MLLETRWRRGAVGRGQESEVRGKAASEGERRTSRICKQSGSRRGKGKGGQEGNGQGESDTGRSSGAVKSRGRCLKG